ncbi:MAG TPA: AraC family transcriptional regulator [Thermoanaerobaculia bacterium]|nr:AraC family transcriptional regulator [Thermoanaerobaculia bacterium]
MPEPTVAAGLARGLMELAVSKGASREVLAERARIDPAELQDQDNRIPFSKYVALMRAGKELCNDPALALHFGETIDMSEMSIVGLIGRAAETGANGFAQINRYARLIVEVDLGTADRFQLMRSAGQLWIVDTRKNPNDFPEMTESTFARMVCASHRSGSEQFAKEVHVTHAAPGHRSEYDRIFRVPVVFESDKNALLTDDAWLTQRNAISVSSRYIFGILSAHADALLESLENSKSTRGHVESLLMPILHTGDASMDVVAGKLGLSRPTLLRKLKAEGVTFEKVLDELRHKMAMHYLSGKKVSVNETAYLVGFSDPAAFSRAFKRWTGSSPRMMRAAETEKDQTGFS